MTPEQAHELARRIANRWRGTPPLRDWADALTPLDHHPAWDTYQRLCRLIDDPGPGIRRYLAEYHAITRTDAPTPHLEPAGPRLPRDRVRQILLDNGASPDLIGTPKETP